MPNDPPESDIDDDRRARVEYRGTDFVLTADWTLISGADDEATVKACADWLVEKYSLDVRPHWTIASVELPPFMPDITDRRPKTNDYTSGKSSTNFLYQTPKPIPPQTRGRDRAALRSPADDDFAY